MTRSETALIKQSMVNGDQIIEQIETFIEAGCDGPALKFRLPGSIAKSVRLLGSDEDDGAESLEDAILEVLGTGGPRGRTAKDIAYRLRKEGYLGITKSDINRCLCRSDAEIEKSSESPPRWRFI